MNAKDSRELEEAAAQFTPRRVPWTKEDKDAVRRFYGRVPVTMLARKLGRTVVAVQLTALRLRMQEGGNNG